MMMGIERSRRVNASRVSASLLGAGYVLLLATAGAAAGDDVSRWDGDARSAARLIAGSPSGHAGAGTLRAGIEIRLKQGRHPYWRYPGDAGVPPQFDFAGSSSVKSVEVLWPAPQRLVEAGGVSIGYVGDVIMPLRITPADSSKPVMLR